MWQVCAATGWSVDYVLWGVNYQTLILMLSDAPRYERKPKDGADDRDDIAGFFQSQLK